MKSDDEVSWRDLLEIPDGAAAETYGFQRLESDRQHLEKLLTEADDLETDVLRVRRQFRFRGQAYLTQEENAALALLLRRAVNLRSSLGDISEFYRSSAGADDAVQIRGMVLGLTAGARDLSFSSFLVAAFLGEKELSRAADAAYLRYDIPRGTFTTIRTEITDPGLDRRAELAYHVCGKALADPDSVLGGLEREDPHYARLIAAGERAFVDSRVRTSYIKSVLGLLLPELDNEMRHSLLARAGEAAWGAMADDAYAMRGMVFKNVARIKEPASKLTVFDPGHREILRDRLEPGDIILTYTSGYMSNVFLPGQFKHGIVFVGAPASRRAAGLTPDYLSTFAVTDAQRERLIELAAREETTLGHPGDLIEAVSEGVKYSSLDYLLDTHISRLLILRPRLDAGDRQRQLADTVARLGAPYDFKFDFSEPSHLCCTELVYRVLEGKGTFDLAFSRTRGHWVLTADDLAREAIRDGETSFEVVLFAEPDPARTDALARLLHGQEAEARLAALFGGDGGRPGSPEGE